MLYGWSLRVDGRAGSYNVYYATLSLSLGLILNIASILVVLEMLTGGELIPDPSKVSKLWLTLPFVAFTAANYIYFRSRNRYKKLIRTYAGSENDLASAPWGVPVAYMATSLALFIGLLFIGLLLH